MAETGFDDGIKKLGECVSKMLKSIKNSADKTAPTADSEKASEETKELESVENETAPVEKDLRDLRIKFASSQAAVLEDFEAYILEYEKNDPQAKGAIKRVLHTWKGEFGVLDLSEFSKFIHDVEDRIERDAFCADNLFRLKDLLAAKLALLSGNGTASLLENETIAVCESAVSDAPPHPAATGAQSPSNLIPPHNNQIAEAAPPDRSISKPVQEEPPLLTTTQDIMASDASLLVDFINESRDHMHTAETLLLELETDPDNKENLNSIFRAWHTVKGVAGFLGLKEVSAIAHRMESRMDLARKGELVLSAGSIDMFLEGNDCLKALVNAVEDAMKGNPFAVPDSYRETFVKFSSPVSSDTQPLVIAAPPEKKVGELLVESGKATQQDVQQALQKQTNGDTRKIGEILLADTEVPARAVAGALAAQNSARSVKNVEETIRVPVNRIDQLVDSIGEAVIAQSMINAHPLVVTIEDQGLHTKIAHANTIMRQIQELAMSLRMVSIKSTFQKMARLARDLSKKCDKEIDFVTEGEDTELDKSVVENIGDPLIHMVRNSIDHGIESAEERKKSGKPEKAMVKLRAFHRAGSIFIEVIDDGKGLDKEAIYRKAVSKGLCAENAILTEQEIFQFIFLPGFSTAKVVTDVSGRGVGMDVVRRNIEALRGSVEISSAIGKGTTFSIRLPLTLAIVDGMVVRSSGEKYIVPTLAILESLKATPEMIQTVMSRGKMLLVRGELITLVHLGALLQRATETWDIANGVVMIVEDMLGKKIGVFLDEIIGQQQVVIKTLGDGMHDIPGITGGAIMNDGTVSLILDVGGIVKLAGEGPRNGIQNIEELAA
jgi:two-component system chemotaxis sensor kinase CheA